MPRVIAHLIFGKTPEEICAVLKSWETRNSEKSYKRECQEKTAPLRLNADFCLGIQPNRLKEWSSSGRKVVVSACEAEKQFFLPVVPFRCCDGTHRF